MSNAILVSWVGNADLRVLARDGSAANAQRILQVSGGQPASRDDGNGPLKSLVEQRDFAEVHLLSDFDPAVVKRYVQWLNCKPTVHHILLENPSDYPSIMEAVRGVLAENTQRSRNLAFHRSPGTPAMAAIGILLGRSQFPATL